MLFEPPGQFCIEHLGQITYRPELTPALRRVFAQRLAYQGAGFDRLFRQAWGLPDREPPQVAEAYVSPRLGRPPEHVYRLKVSLQWRRSTWDE